jgi:hypothetical protein
MESDPKIDTDGAVINHLMATGEMLASQLPLATSWSPEKRLAAAVLTSALISLRDRQHDSRHRIDVEEDLAWLSSDDVRAPYAFLRLCDVFGLEPTWVRQVARGWGAAPESGRRRGFSMHRNAA